MLMLRVSSRSRLLRYVLLFDEVTGFFDWSESGRGVFSLLAWPSWDSVGLRRFADGGGM